MPMIKLTKRAIADLPAPDPSGKQVLHWDEELKGFGVLCSGVTREKTFVVQRAVRGRTRRVTLGKITEYAAAGKTIEHAREAAGHVLLDLRAGRDPKARADADVTLREALDRYLEARPNLAASSRAGYRASVKHHFAAWLDCPLRDLTPEMIEERHREIRDEVATARKRAAERARRRAERRGEAPVERDTFVAEPGAAAANTALRTLRVLWYFAAARAPELPPWPAARLRGQWFRVPRREQHVAADDLERFYAAVNATEKNGNYALGRAPRDLILLLLFTGLRRREATGLRWTDVDLAARIIRLSHKSTKSGRRLDLPMSDLVHGLLVARRALGTEGAFVFAGPGRSGHLEEPKRAFAAVARRCGVSVSPHALRATFITVAADCPISPYALKGLVNHSVGDDVTSGYVQLTTEGLRGPAQLVAERLEGYCGLAAEEAENVRPMRPALKD